jgi:protein-tyrosine-phosphatase
VGAMVEERMVSMKMEIMQEVGVKIEESSKEVKDALTFILDLVHALAGNRN